MPKPIEPMKRWEDFNEEEQSECYNSVNSCPNITVADEDSIEVVGYHIYIHEKARASKIKGRVHLTPFQWRQLIRAILEEDGEIEDWSAVDLSWVMED